MATNLLNSLDRSLLKLVNDEDDENIVISLNYQFVAFKFDEFQYDMNYLLTHNCHFDAINQQETCNDTYYNDFT